MRLELSRAADRDVNLILAYGAAHFGIDAARRYLFGFDPVFALLRSNPFAGEPADDLRPGLRRFSYRRHRIFYRVEDDRIFVARILHHAMDAKRQLRRG